MHPQPWSPSLDLGFAMIAGSVLIAGLVWLAIAAARRSAERDSKIVITLPSAEAWPKDVTGRHLPIVIGPYVLEAVVVQAEDHIEVQPQTMIVFLAPGAPARAHSVKEF